MGHIECWFDDGEYSNGTGTTYNIKYILPKYWKHNVSKANSKSQSVGNWLYLEFLKKVLYPTIIAKVYSTVCINTTYRGDKKYLALSILWLILCK